jgi:3-hydroxyacyl-[acyl-carrier-protein] dehydratase
MRFSLIDRVDELEPGRHIAARKNLTMAEEYLADHFPGFPVMPGVLMLEAMTQAGAWLIRASEDFAHSIVVLKEARNVKYGNFVEPGQTLHVTAEIIKQDERTTTLKAQGTVDGSTSVSARLVLERYNLADVEPNRAEADAVVRGQLREQWAQLCRHLTPATT